MIKNLGEQDRERHLREIVPELFKKHDGILYVGCKIKKSGRIPEHVVNFGKGFVAVLEIDIGNCNGLIDSSYYGNKIHDVVLGDVRKATCYFRDVMFDYSVWWHGPEHIALSDLGQAILELSCLTKKKIIMACPWGNAPQSAVGGNIAEIHVQPMYPEYFEKFGFDVYTEGPINRIRNSNILAVKDVGI